MMIDTNKFINSIDEVLSEYPQIAAVVGFRYLMGKVQSMVIVEVEIFKEYSDHSIQFEAISDEVENFSDISDGFLKDLKESAVEAIKDFDTTVNKIRKIKLTEEISIMDMPEGVQ